MDEMTIGDILNDFRSIKLSTAKRDFIDRCRIHFQAHGNLPLEMKVELRNMVKRYSRQFNELHESRARARRTRGLRKSGLTLSEANDLVRRRRENMAAQKSDVGF